MIILALNCGSSSIKFQLYDWDDKKLIVKGLIERIGQKKSNIKFSTDTLNKKLSQHIENHVEGVSILMNLLIDKEYNILNDITDIKAVGHRVVHGADKFAKSVIIDEDVLQTIKDVAFLAPLHNPANISGIEAAKTVLPSVTQVAVFDTAFHQTMPEYAYMYAVPYEWYADHKVRRYGFHGSSHLYVSKRAAVALGKNPQETNLITMHIGNGVSHTAIKNGVSVDTSMGLTPLEGAVMGTRSGDMDPAIISYIMKKENLKEEDVESILNKKSGLLGITGKYSDRRDVLQGMEEGNQRCKLAVELEAYRLKKYIGSYMAVLGQVDAIVFTAGVGENNPVLREKACHGLEAFGIKIDSEKNVELNGSDHEVFINAEDSKVKILVIPTNEEIVMIEDIVALIEDKYNDHLHMKYSFLK